MRNVLWMLAARGAARFAHATSLALATSALAAVAIGCTERGERSSGPHADTREDGGEIAAPLADGGARAQPPDASSIDPDGGATGEPCAVRKARVLILYGGAVQANHSYALHAIETLSHHGVDFEVRALDEDVRLREDGSGRYAALLVTDYDAFEALPSARRRALDAYARDCGAGQYFLHLPAEATLGDAGDLATGARRILGNARVDPLSGVLDLTRDGGVLEGNLPGHGRLFDVEDGAGYVPIAWASDGAGDKPWLVADDGRRDGVRRVFNGRDLSQHFLDELLLLDALAWLSPVELGIARERYVGIDIDDVFMPAYNEDWRERKEKIQAEDVPALLETQARIAALIGGDFRFNLGFNAYFYGTQHDDPALYDDAAGDAALVAERSSFHWFDHLYRHTIIIDQPYEEIAGYLERGHSWAEETGVIDYVGRYAITPQHSGTSQRWEPLYQAWRDVWDVRYSADTSDAGEGFEFLGIHVMPRSTAGIWSDEYSFDQVGRARLDALARDVVYRTIVAHPVSVFMTHQSNYCRDRIGNYLFEAAFTLVQRWTRYRIINARSDELVAKYFELMPLEEGDP